jgi:hypothetical protein
MKLKKDSEGGNSDATAVGKRKRASDDVAPVPAPPAKRRKGVEEEKKDTPRTALQEWKTPLN